VEGSNCRSSWMLPVWNVFHDIRGSWDGHKWGLVPPFFVIKFQT